MKRSTAVLVTVCVLALTAASLPASARDTAKPNSRRGGEKSKIDVQNFQDFLKLLETKAEAGEQIELPQNVRDTIIGISILIGAIQCFFGYRIFKFILGLVGFIVGGTLAGAIGFAVYQQEAVALLAGIVGGIIGAALMVLLYFVGIFLFGACLGAALGMVLFSLTGISPEPIALLILAVITGIIALVVQKFMIIVSTGFGGAWSVVTGIAYFTTGAIDPTNPVRMFRSGGKHLYAIALCWLVLGIVGVIVQYKTAPTKKTEALPPAPLDGKKSSALS
ncbi:MAG: TMEM198/TM7SF3 family protein [Phycisphaerae bacterium]|jgi:hypothetical protein|nr:TMEM198/TM7SF3 family protein [Phycisphaerae bacterium]